MSNPIEDAMLTAEDAKKISDENYAKEQLKPIFHHIKDAAKGGNYRILWTRHINDVLIKKLRDLGYAVTNCGGDYQIAWGRGF